MPNTRNQYSEYLENIIRLERELESRDKRDTPHRLFGSGIPEKSGLRKQLLASSPAFGHHPQGDPDLI